LLKESCDWRRRCNTFGPHGTVQARAKGPEEAARIERYRQLWDARFDELEKVVEELKRKEKVDGRRKRK
jgi:hypothetical protein